MPSTVTNLTHDSAGALWRIVAAIPDTGVAVNLTAVVLNADGTTVGTTNTGDNSPGVPVSGSNFVLYQWNKSDLGMTVKSSTSAYPSPDSGYTAVARQQIDSTDDSRPFTWAGIQFMF